MDSTPPPPHGPLARGPATVASIRHGRALMLAVFAVPFLAATTCGPSAEVDAAEATTAADGDGVPRARVERLVRRLGSGASADRDAAAHGLAALGPAALSMITAARRHSSGETSYRLADIERLLLKRATDEAVEPALVTLVAEDAPANDVLRRLFSQAGSRIEIVAAADRRLSWRCDRLTFWEAVDDLLAQSGLALEFHAPPDGRTGTAAPRLQIVDAPAGVAPPPSVAAGPIRVSVAAIERTGRQSADTADTADTDGRRRGVRIILRVAWEPRLEPLLVRLPARSLVAEGPAGEALPAAQRSAVIEATIAPRRQWVDLPVLFAPPAAPLERLGMLRGTIILWLRGYEHPFGFADVHVDRGPTAGANAGPQRVGQAEVRLLDTRREGDRFQVRASVAYDTPAEPLASHHSWLATRKLEVIAAEGMPLHQLEQRVETRTDRGVTVAAEFAMPPSERETAAAQSRNVLIRWTLPIAIHELPVDFAVRDVPLPASRPR